MHALTSNICLLRSSVSSYHTWATGNTFEHDRSSEQLRFSPYSFRQPFIRTLMIERRTPKEYWNRSNKVKSTTNSKIANMARPRESNTGTHHFISGEEELVKEPETRRDKTPWMWRKESATAPEPRFFLLTILCFAFSFPRIVVWIVIPWRNLGLYGFVERIEIKVDFISLSGLSQGYPLLHLKIS